MLSALFHAKNVNLDGSSQRCIFSDDPMTPFDSSSSVVTWRRTDGITGIPPFVGFFTRVVAESSS